jgi:AcrR family transcriptional regulator
MARPVETEDAALLDAAARALAVLGPAEFTLAKAGAHAGVAAATLVKRFGSKRGVFVRLSRRWVESLDAELDAVEAAAPSPLAAVRALALHSYHDLDRPDTAHRQLAALAVDLQDDELRDLLHQGWGKVTSRLRDQVALASAAGQLTGAPPPAQLARILHAAMEGGCLFWSVHPEGSLIERLGSDLDVLLSAWTAEGEESHE